MLLSIVEILLVILFSSISLIPTSSLMGVCPFKRIHEQSAFLVEFLLSRLGLFLCLLLLFFGHRLSLLQLLDTQGGVEFFRVIIQIKQPWSTIGCNDERHHGMAIGIFIVRCLGEAKQLFFCLFDAWHILMVVDLAIAIEDGASSGA